MQIEKNGSPEYLQSPSNDDSMSRHSRITKSKESNDLDLPSPEGSSQGTDYKAKLLSLMKSPELASKRLSDEEDQFSSEVKKGHQSKFLVVHNNFNVGNESGSYGGLSDHHILSPNESNDSMTRPQDYQLSPLHEKYANIEELKSSTLKRQQEMIEEINSMKKQGFEIANQMSTDLGDNYEVK